MGDTAYRFERLMEEIRAGRRVAVTETHVPELGCTLVRDGTTGREVAIFHGDTIQARRERWPTRLHGATLTGTWAPAERWTAGQRRTFDALVAEPRNAVLRGGTGRGKTMVAVAALRALYVEKGVSALGIPYAELKRRLEPRWLDANGALEANVLAQFAAPAVLLLDDVGYGDTSHLATGHEKRLLLELAQLREAGGRHTWITTNLMPNKGGGDPLDSYGEAAMSRIGAGAVVYNFGQRDFRKSAQVGG